MYIWDYCYLIVDLGFGEGSDLLNYPKLYGINSLNFFYSICIVGDGCVYCYLFTCIYEINGYWLSPAGTPFGDFPVCWGTTQKKKKK